MPERSDRRVGHWVKVGPFSFINMGLVTEVHWNKESDTIEVLFSGNSSFSRVFHVKSSEGVLVLKWLEDRSQL